MLLSLNPSLHYSLTPSVQIGRRPMLAFELQHHPADVPVLRVRRETAQALLRIAPLHDLDHFRPQRPSCSCRAASPYKGRSCSGRRAPSRNLPPGKVDRLKPREKSCPPASATNRPRRFRRSGRTTDRRGKVATARRKRSIDSHCAGSDCPRPRPEWPAARKAARRRAGFRPWRCGCRTASWSASVCV